MGNKQEHTVKKKVRSERINGVSVLPQGLEETGVAELLALGAKAVKPLRRAVSFEADMACLYRLHYDRSFLPMISKVSEP